MSKGLKYTLWITGSFFLLIVLLLVFTQTAYFKQKVKEQLIKQSGQFLNAELQIDKLRGNFFSGIEFENVRLFNGDKEVLSFESLHLNYSLWPLLEKEIRINSVLLQSPKLNIWQEKDSTWNLTSILKQQDLPENTKQAEFNFRIEIPGIELKNGTLSIAAFSEIIPKETNDLNILAGFSYSNKKLAVDLKKLNFKAHQPDLILNELSGKYLMTENEMRLDDLKIRTAGSNIDAKGEYQSPGNFLSDLSASPIDSSEMMVFVPALHLKCSPSFNTSFKTTNDLLAASFELRHRDEIINAEIQLSPVTALIKRDGNIPFSLDLLFTNFELENWIELSDIEAKLEGTVNINGDNLLHPDQNTHVVANLTHSSFNRVDFDTFDLRGSWQENSITANLDLSSGFGQVKGWTKLQNLQGTQDYEINLYTTDLNLEAFVPEMEHTILNASVQAKGAGLDIKRIRSAASIEILNSSVYNFRVDSLVGKLNWHRNQINIDSLFLLVPGASATGEGVVYIDSMRMYSTIKAKIDSLNVIDSFVSLPIRFDSLLTNISINGPFDRLQLKGTAEAYNTVAYDASLEQAQFAFNVDLNTDSLLISTTTEAQKINYAGFHWDSLRVNMDYLPGQVKLAALLDLPDTLTLETEAIILLDSILSIEVPKLELQTLLSNYYLPDNLEVQIEGGQNFSIDDFKLLDHNNANFLVQAGGVVSMSDSNSLKISVHDLDLGLVNRFFDAGDSINGTLNSELSLSGTPRFPELAGKIDLIEPSYGTYSISALNATLNYKNEKFSAEILNPDSGDAFLASVSVPLKAYLDSMNFVFTKPDSMSALINLNNLDIHDYGKQFVPHDSIRGNLNVHLESRGSIQNPEIYGNIRLENASYQNKRIGIDYGDIIASINFQGNQLLIDTLMIRQKKGFLTMNGELVFDSTMVRGNILATSLQADARNFFITQHRNYEVQIDANTFVKTGNGEPVYGGNIKVLRSDVFLPAIMKDERPGAVEDLPMLVKALETKQDSFLITNTLADKKLSSEELGSQFINRLRGRLNVEIPRNTWIRSEDMRLEIGGDVEIVKTGPDFELFGSVKLLRGYYLLYGKKLNIKESEVIFEGGDDFDPILNFQAEHIFRGSDRQKRYLDLLVTGKLSEPTISFKLDGTEITENDGVSVLLFGATSDQIGYSEQEGMIGSIGSQALAGMITSQLSKTIGAQFNLDMIEITATDNWQSAAFVVGKYITNDIFVIYERGFGEVDGDEITPETITVEYELNDMLFLRLQSGSSITSGFDVILKFEQDMKKKKLKTPKEKE